MNSYVDHHHHAAPAMMMMQPVLVQPGPARRFSAMGHEFAASGLTMPPNVIRLPRGPDKGKGFQHWCKNRMQTSQPIHPRSRKPATAPAPIQRKSRAIPIGKLV